MHMDVPLIESPRPRPARSWREQVIPLGPAHDRRDMETLRHGILDGSLTNGQPSHLVVLCDDAQWQRDRFLQADGIDATGWSIGLRWLRYQHQTGHLYLPTVPTAGIGNGAMSALAVGVAVADLSLQACDPRSPIPADWLSRDQVQLFLHLRR